MHLDQLTDKLREPRARCRRCQDIVESHLPP